MKSGAVGILACVSLLALLGGCSSTPGPRAPTEVSSMVFDVEARAGAADGPRVASEGTLSAGYQPSNCCALDVHISRAYLGKGPDAEDLSTVKELTDIGLGLTATLSDHVRLRLRGGLAAAPPSRKEQRLMRPGVGGDAAVLFRLFPWNAERRQAGEAHAQLDLVLGVHGWSLGSPRTSAGIEGGSSRIVAVTAGLRLAFDYGIDLR